MSQEKESASDVIKHVTDYQDSKEDDTGAVDQEDGPQRSTMSKVTETGFLILTWLAISTYVEIYGPTLIDLKSRLHTDYEHIALAVSGKSVGWFPGSILAGFLTDRFSGYCHLIIAVGLNVAAAVTAAIPWSPNVTYTWVFCFAGGFVESNLNIAGTRILFKIWRKKSFTPLMLIYVGYGIGSFIVPLYSNPFLDNKLEQSPNMNTTLDSNSTLQSGMTTLKPTEESPETLLKDNSRIEYAYCISAAIVACVSIAFYCYQVREFRTMKGNRTNIGNKTESTPKEKRSLKEMVNPATCAGGRFCYGTQLLLLLFLYFGNIGGGDSMVGSFIRSYSIDQHGFSKDSASFINTSVWITFSVGRLAFAFIARCVSVRFLIIFETGGMAVSSILLMIFANDSSLSLWILIQFFAFFCSASWPTGVAWTDYHMELTGLGMTVQVFGASVGGVCHMLLIGYIYENYGPRTFLYQIVGYGVLQFIIAVLLNIVGARHGSRFSPDDKKVVDVNISTIT